MLLTAFVAARPRYEMSQHRSLAWLAEVHAAAEASSHALDVEQRERFGHHIGRVLARCSSPPEALARRGHSVADLEAVGFARNTLYDVIINPRGRGTAARTQLFTELVDDYFTRAYLGEHEPPDDLVHVTSTGYAAPSGAQKLVARRGWGAATRVTHAYHMGCHAAAPALRIAAGFVGIGARRVDLVHTELCSLHLDPMDHRVDQLAVQALYADGFIRYSMLAGDAGPGLLLVSSYEEILPDTAGAMSWRVGDHGLQMNVRRDAAELVTEAVRGVVTELYRRGGLDLGRLRDGVYAVHPGSARILDRVARALELAPPQLAASRAVLRDHGNMSSATLPHVWMRLLDDPDVPRGTLIPSLAFGPGLTVCGMLLEKR